jgi:hypothetical protein
MGKPPVVIVNSVTAYREFERENAGEIAFVYLYRDHKDAKDKKVDDPRIPPGLKEVIFFFILLFFISHVFAAVPLA